jgi:formate hydrogenlyase subunit 3/multisubunit Na+/H+ antiporter MnhD subunit
MRMIIVFSIMVIVLPALLAAAACSFTQRRHRKAAWHVAILSCILSGFLCAILIYQGDVFYADSWQDHGRGSPVRMCFLIGSGVGLFPGLSVVRFYRERFSRQKDPAS